LLSIYRNPPIEAFPGSEPGELIVPDPHVIRLGLVEVITPYYRQLVIKNNDGWIEVYCSNITTAMTSNIPNTYH
jgi:hypothetical protein